MVRVGRVMAIVAAVVLSTACSGSAGTAAPPATSTGSSPTPSPVPAATVRPPASPIVVSPSASPPAVTNLVSDRYPYSIWIPSDWSTGTMGDADAFQGPAGEQIDVRYYPSITDDPDAWFTKARDVLDGFAPIAEELAVNHPAGTARWFELHPTSQGQTLDLYRLVLIAGGDGWDVTWTSPTGFEDVNRPLFIDIANQFWPLTGPLNVWSLGAGDCFTSLPISQPGDAGGDVVFVGPLDQFAPVECTEPHTGEVFEALTEVDAECGDAFEAFVGRSLDGSQLKLMEFVPLHASDLPEGIASLCVVADPSGSSAGSAKGSGR